MCQAHHTYRPMHTHIQARHHPKLPLAVSQADPVSGVYEGAVVCDVCGEVSCSLECHNAHADECSMLFVHKVQVCPRRLAGCARF
jgi:hypothetical protein